MVTCNVLKTIHLISKNIHSVELTKNHHTHAWQYHEKIDCNRLLKFITVTLLTLKDNLTTGLFSVRGIATNKNNYYGNIFMT